MTQPDFNAEIPWQKTTIEMFKKNPTLVDVDMNYFLRSMQMQDLMD